jgi:hypothetical protein
MSRPDQSAKRGKGRSPNLQVIWECCPNLSAQAQAILAFMGLDLGGISASATTKSSPERGGDDDQGVRP